MNLSLPADRPLRILVTRADRIGDLVLSTPVFRALRQKFPKSHLAALTFCENGGLLEGHPDLSEVILYDKKGREKSWLGNFRFARALAQKKFDVVIHLHATNRMHLVTWLAGIPVRIGYERRAPWTLTHSLPDIKKEGRKHEAAYNFELLKSFGIEEPASFEPVIHVSQAARTSLEMICHQLGIPGGRPRVVLNPSASCPSKVWPVERFAALADRLHETYNATVIVIGSDRDRAQALRLAELAKTPVYNLAGRLSLQMLAALLSKSDLLVSNDSGPVHIATAVKTPVVSIFGRKDPGLSPERWRPLGARDRYLWKDVGCEVCLAHNCEIAFLCLEAVSVDDVLGAIATIERFGEKEAARL